MRLVASAWLFACLPASLVGQPRGWLRVQVVDSAGAALEQATVSVANAGSKLTGKSGTAEFGNLAAGSYEIVIRRVGYHAVSAAVQLPPNDDGVIATVTLHPAPVELAPLVVRVDPVAAATARLKGFEYRRQTGLGRYFTREVVERQHAMRVSELLRKIPSGVMVRDSVGIPQAVSMRGKKLVWDRQLGLQTASCVMRLILDGQLMPWGTSLDIIDPSQIEGIEIYLGPSEIPAEFVSSSRDVNCGLVVLWTR